MEKEELLKLIDLTLQKTFTGSDGAAIRELCVFVWNTALGQCEEHLNLTEEQQEILKNIKINK